MRYAIVVLLTLFLIIIGIVVLIGRGNRNASTQTASTVKLADQVDKDFTRVSWTMQGELVGEEERRAVRVTVSESERVVEVLEGYEENIGKRKTFANTKAAFDTFIQALDRLGFGRQQETKITDERGVCPLGNRFIYELSSGGEQIFRTWSDNCLDSNGTYGGSTSLARQIFKNQITDYDKFVRGVDL
jgi:hypothetical protein